MRHAGEKAAAAIADFLVVDMFANFCTGREDAKGAIAMRRAAGEAHLSLRRDHAAGGRSRPAAGSFRPQFVLGAELSRMVDCHDLRATRADREPSAWSRLKVNRHWLGFWFMLPALAFLVLFLAYPLGLGVWLSFTDTKIGRAGEFIGLENYEWLWGDSIFWLSVFNTLLYTIVASVIKFGARTLSRAAAQRAPAVQGDASAPRC